MKNNPIDYSDLERPLELSDLTAEQYNFFKNNIWNGVGTSVHICFFLDPITDPADMIFAPASLNHDWYYYLGHKFSDKLKADWKYFKESIRASIRYKHKLLIPFFILVSCIYSLFLFLFGFISFEFDDHYHSFDEVLSIWEKDKEKKNNKSNNLTWKKFWKRVKFKLEYYLYSFRSKFNI